jgi:hypothetical protein
MTTYTTIPSERIGPLLIKLDSLYLNYEEQADFDDIEIDYLINLVESDSKNA